MERTNLLQDIEKAFNITFTRGAVITREMALEAIPQLLKLKPEMLRLLPRQNTKRIRKELTTGRQAITVLSEILILKGMKLLSTRKYFWDSEKKKQFARYKYKII